MADFRTLPNGYKIAPQRGTPPPAPEGYEMLESEPYVYVPTIPDCKDREIRDIKRSCCSSKQVIVCHKFDKFVIRLRCAECQVPTQD